MHFAIRHTTRYRYPAPVRLGPQDLRFHPRADGAQNILQHRLRVTPEPVGRVEHLDLEGNRVTRVCFDGETDHLGIEVEMQVETLRHSAGDIILAPGAASLPVDYGGRRRQAEALLRRWRPAASVSQFAADLAHEAQGDTLAFLDALAGRLFADIDHVLRETGEPQTPAQTLHCRRGACRDITVLFLDCCRAQGIAARFASGYQRGDLKAERRHLHAWPEVYLPGAGWRGYDPTHGEAIADTHVTIAAAANPMDTMPVTGSFYGSTAASRLDYTVHIEVSGE